MKIEEDLAEVKGMLKSLFMKMEKSEEEEQPTEKGAIKSALGPKVAQGRLDRESLAQLCWEGEFTKYQKMVFVSAPIHLANFLCNICYFYVPTYYIGTFYMHDTRTRSTSTSTYYLYLLPWTKCR